MKLFKKVLAVALVGAMAVSMLTACGNSAASKEASVRNALKKVGVTTNSNMNKEADAAADALQDVTKAIKAGDSNAVSAAQTKVASMTEFSFASQDATNAQYDLYIWTNGVKARPTNPVTEYPYLMKFENKHTGDRLAALLTEDFVKMGEFKDTSANLDVLKKVLGDAEVAGVSCQSVYGYDVLFVVVKKGATVNPYTPTSIKNAQ